MFKKPGPFGTVLPIWVLVCSDFFWGGILGGESLLIYPGSCPIDGFSLCNCPVMAASLPFQDMFFVSPDALHH